MGMLVDGVWQRQDVITSDKKGNFVRKDSSFRNWITADGAPGPSGEGGFAAEADRYHLYISYACPWAHRTLIFRHLKELTGLIDLSIVDYFMGEDGWSFSDREGAIRDPLMNASHVSKIYVAADPTYTGKVTVPVLWDKKKQTIVSNESSEIIRMFNSAFNDVTGNQDDYYPEALRSDIDLINERVYETLNNGVYRSGFARSQEAYESAVMALFDTLDFLEARLGQTRYLCGGILSEADWRLFVTLVRFDAVYVGHFKCNKQRIVDYANLSNYLRDLYQMPGIAETVNLTHIKNHYYESHETVNPTRIVPLGPDLDFHAPHDRARFSG